MSPKIDRCMARGPNLSAWRMPSQFWTGCGGFHRNSPTGGAAKGMPLNARTPGFDSTTPCTTPLAVLTQSAGRTSAVRRKAVRRIARERTLRWVVFIWVLFAGDSAAVRREPGPGRRCHVYVLSNCYPRARKKIVFQAAGYLREWSGQVVMSAESLSQRELEMGRHFCLALARLFPDKMRVGR